MKQKIVGILICMLLIVTAAPAVESLNDNAITPTVSSNGVQRCTQANWNEIQKLLPSDGIEDAYFGGSVSVDGDTAFIGAEQDDANGFGSGAVYVFTRTGTTWTQQQKFLASDGKAGDGFGNAVTLNGDTALIGAGLGSDDNKGSAYVFTRSGTTWTQQAKLLASDGEADDHFGCSVSVDGNTALIGAMWDDDNGFWSGSAYVFTRSGTTWTKQVKLLASDGAITAYFGYSVSVNGDTALIGAFGDNENGDDSGSVYVFTRTGTSWTQKQKLLASDGAAYDEFGCSVALDGDTALIGALGDDDAKGSAYVFTRSGTTWTKQVKLLASGGSAGDWFGAFVALSDDTALIGATLDDDNGVDSGSAYVFTRTGITWTQQGKLVASDGAAGDAFGYSVSIDGSFALIGVYYDDDNGEDSGSAYVFMKSGLDFDIIGGLGVNIKITNNGMVKSTVVDWEIHVEGGILGIINKTVDGTVDIPVGQSKIVGTGLFFGFGALTITAKVADEEQTATGKQIIIFSIVKK